MTPLFNFQKTGSLFLQLNDFSMLADQMGVGKTPQAIDASRSLKRIITVVPSVAKYNWQKEYQKFAERDSIVIEGDPRNTIEDLANFFKNTKNPPPLIASFENVTKYLDFYTSSYKWDVTKIDEAHYLKNPERLTTGRTKSLIGSEGLIQHTKRLWALTGTPAPNHAGEIWVWLYVFGFTKLSYQGFISRYCNCHETGGRYSRLQITGSNTKHTPELKVLLNKMSLRRLKKDVLDLPPFFHNTYFIEGSTDATIFKNHPYLKDKLRAELDVLQEKLGFSRDISDERMLRVLMVLSQSMTSVRRYHGLKKVVPVADIIAKELEAQEYEKIVLFGVHIDVLYSLAKILEKFGVVLATGRQSSRQKFEAQEIFQSSPKIRVFIGQVIAAGTNLTLTAADQLAFIEQDWVPGNNQQAADRLHRYGQLKSITARHFAVRNSIDEKITATLTRKIQELSTFID